MDNSWPSLIYVGWGILVYTLWLSLLFAKHNIFLMSVWGEHGFLRRIRDVPGKTRALLFVLGSLPHRFAKRMPDARPCTTPLRVPELDAPGTAVPFRLLSLESGIKLLQYPQSFEDHQSSYGRRIQNIRAGRGGGKRLQGTRRSTCHV